MAARKKAKAAPVRVHVENNPTTADVYHVTPALFRKLAKKMPGLSAKISVSFGNDPGQLDARLQETEILLTGGFDASNLATRAPHLKWVQSTSAGVEKLAPYIPEGIVLTNASGVHMPKGGEYAMTALLMLNHRVPHFVTAQHAARWDQAFATPIAGKTVLILGVGAIGSAAARLARRFGMRVVGVSRSGKRDKLVDRMYKPKDLKKALPQADFVLAILPLTEETRGLLGRAELDLLPRHAGLVNLGRGPVIDNDALADKLRKGELSGAVLDVYPEEPLPSSSPLWATPNLIMSPHCAVDDATSYAERALALFLGNLKRYVAGRQLMNVVDTRLGY
ncbi:MAG TPA: D-2-hydroxyacid dehydrogenase [Stellaceae bacterium]|jgi:phosphoglycerate dehydrogenase-like enzyme|nr:D-2-hydroxyacid dehydrogenase [Stellaceae bacterium]